MKTIGFVMLLVGMAGSAVAGAAGNVPEIDATSAVGALALLGGGLLVIRARRKK